MSKVLPFGMNVGHPWQNEEFNVISASELSEKLDFSFWYNWKHDHLEDNIYIPMVFYCKFGDYFNGAKELGKNNPGRLWFLGNEPEVETQGNTSTEEFVLAVKDWRLNVHGKIALPGCSVVFQDAKDWMDRYVILMSQDEEFLVPDFWHIHAHGLKNFDQWYGWWETWKNGWWSIHGRGRPVIISETCGIQASSLQEQVEMIEKISNLTETDEALLSVFWFSTFYGFTGSINKDWNWSWLLDSQQNLTELGNQTKGFFNSDVSVEDDYNIFLPKVIR